MTELNEPAGRRIPELDGIRGLAILLVLVWHYVPCEFGSLPPLFRFLNLTWSGVDLFFVLSGFLIGGILLDHREAPNYFGAFYGRRACRILPFYYLWLLLYAVLSGVRGHLGLGTAADWMLGPGFPLWSYASFTQNFLQAKSASFGPYWLAATWSLAIEEQFYLLLPLAIRFTPRRWLPYLLGIVIAAAPVARWLLWDPAQQGGVATVVLLITKADVLGLGVLCAWLVRRDGAVAAIPRAAPLLRVALFSALGYQLLACWAPETATKQAMSDLAYGVAYASLLLLAVYMPASPFGRMTRWSWLRRLGLIAYSTYLMHQAMGGVVFGAVYGRWPYILRIRELLLNIPALLLVIGLAAVSWRWFEKPIMRWGHRFSYERR